MRIVDHLKKDSFDKDIRWIVKYSKAGKVIEIKQLFDPKNFEKNNKHKRKILNKEELITILENDKA
tara:strand:+ start:26103 stop:26300 length:198 start_codon:yes stop_codon:yes gene_type:complete